MKRLIDDYDAALFDLDGVVYLGMEPVVGAVDGIAMLRKLDKKVGFVTNNSARFPQTVVDHLVALGIPCTLEDVITSTQASIRMMRREIHDGARILVCGSPALATQLAEAGYQIVETWQEKPDAVIIGYYPKITWPRLDQAAIAIANGAKWFASNTDSTRPTAEGTVPGAGAIVAAVGLCVPDQQPMVAGKPYAPLLDLTVERLSAKAPIFVGDRLDTDIEGAVGVGMDSFLVFTGTHGKRDLIEAVQAQRPTWIGADIRSMCQAPRQANLSGNTARCGCEEVQLIDGKLVLKTNPTGLEAQLDALWAGTQLAWENERVDAEDFLVRLDELH